LRGACWREQAKICTLLLPDVARKGASLGLCALIASAAAAVAGPAEPGDKSSGQAEIIVTGERVRRALKDTAPSVAVFTQDGIEAQAADRVDQLLAGIPNVQLGNGSEGPAIRGQDSTGVLQALDGFLGGARPRATLEVDGRAAGFQEYVFGTAPLWDVRQVEVFRSPLTVTHGRNSIAGGIVITTNDPTYEWEGRARGIIGDFSTRQLSGVISGPIVGDQLAFRLTGDTRHARTTSELGRNQRGADPNDDDYSAARFKLLLEPKAVPGLKVLGTYSWSHSQMPQVVDANAPFRERRNPDARYGIFGVRVNAATLHATQQLGSGQVEAILSSGRTKSRRFAPPGIGEARIRLNDVSADIFGNWRASPTLTLWGGVHALQSRLRQYIDLSNFIDSEGRFRDRQHSFGAFGEAELAVNRRLKLSAGGRYQQDKQRRFGGLTGRVDAPVDFDLRFSAWLPKVSATYALTPRINAGLLIQKAYNPGGATVALNTGETDTFAAERLWDYEAFLKGSVPSLGLTIAANLFYNAMRDAQRGVLVPFTLPDGSRDFFVRFNNLPKARSYGSEVELDWRASSDLTLRAGIGLLSTRVLRADPSEVIGREFERSPHFSGVAAADWTPVDRLRLSAQLRHRTGYFSDDFNTPELRVGRATSMDVRAAYDIGRFTAFVYARNLFDRLNILYLYASVSAELEDPRMVGFGLEARF
jgi:outer membrane receptor protein involved in Fe transport